MAQADSRTEPRRRPQARALPADPEPNQGLASVVAAAAFFAATALALAAMVIAMPPQWR
jgi:hypothetical protein